MRRMRDGHQRFAHPFHIVAAVSAVLASAACKTEPSRSTAGSVNAQTGAAPSGGTATLAADDGQWVRPAKDFASTRFSGLTEITPATVKSLRPIATFSTGVVRGHEAAPLVV